MSQKLTRSSNKMIAGVCAGVGEYFNIDPTIVRIVWALATLAGGAGILAYIICLLVMPQSNE